MVKNNNRSNQPESKFCRCSQFFSTFLCRCFAWLQCETSRNFLVSCFLKERSYVFLFSFFSLPLIFTLHWWLLAFLLSLPPLQNFHVVIPTKKCLLFLSLALDLCCFFSHWALLACRLLCLFLGCFSLALYFKFVDLTINLCLIL